MKQNAKGIERLYRLIGSDQRFDYRYGMFTTEYSSDCLFRISFSQDSFLRRLGMPPKLIIRTNQKKYEFYGMQDYDESKRSWFFPINDRKMVELADASSIVVMKIEHFDNDLDLFQYEPNVWSAFFRAGVAECIEATDGSLELESFYLQRALACARFEIMTHLKTSKEAIAEMADIVLDPHLYDVATSVKGVH